MSKCSKELVNENRIINWGYRRFNGLKEDNKVKMWLKVYDKKSPQKFPDSLKIEINLSLLANSELVHRLRSILPKIDSTEFDLAQRIN